MFAQSRHVNLHPDPTAEPALDYARVAEAIAYLRAHRYAQPSLAEVAAAVHLSPQHFHRIFSRWAGVSPKRFVEYLTVDYAKRALAHETPVKDAAYGAGLADAGGLRRLFVRIEGMSPGAYQRGGAGLAVEYAFAKTPFGETLVASTPRGICWLAFVEVDGHAAALDDLRAYLPNAHLTPGSNALQTQAIALLDGRATDGQSADGVPADGQLLLHLRGTPFQLKVWEALLSIDPGHVSTYGALAASTGSPGAARAVGTAVGRNPVAALIPCHRVIRATGELGGYRWGETRKAALLGREAVAWEAR